MKRLSTVLIFTLILSLFPFVLIKNVQAELGVSDFLDQTNFVSPTYGVGLWGGKALLGWDDSFFENYLLPMGIRLIYGLDTAWYSSGMGRANTATTDIQYSSAVDAFLSRADKYGVLVTFNAPLKDYADNPWAGDVVAAQPELTTYDQNGNPWTNNYIMIDSPLVAQQLFEDLKQLYDYYGEHPSWIGFGALAFTDMDGYTGYANAWRHQMKNETFLNYTQSIFHTDHPGCNLAWTNATINEKYNDVENYHKSSSVYSQDPNDFRKYIMDQQHVAFVEAAKLFENYTGKPWITTVTEPFAEPYKWRDIRDYISTTVTQAGVASNSSGLFADTQTDWRGYMSTLSLMPLQYGPKHSFIWNSLSSNGDFPNNLTPWQIGKQFLLEVPFTSGTTFHVFDYQNNYGSDPGPNGIRNLTEQAYSRTFGEILNRMRNVGGYYGFEKNTVKVLVLVGGGAFNSLQYLTPALNITAVVGPNSDGNLTRYGDLGQFDVILIGPTGGGSPVPLTSNAMDRIEQFVKNGGGLVIASGSEYGDSFNDMMGFDAVSDIGSLGSLVIDDPANPILRPYGTSILTGGFGFYRAGSVKFVKVPNSEGVGIINSTLKGAMMFQNQYYSGRSVFVPWAGSTWNSIGGGGGTSWSYYSGAPRDSWMVLVNNAIFWAAKKENLIPTWWYSEYKSGGQVLPWNEETFYSIDGRPGDPVLVWFTNNGTANDIELHLNRSFYGISNNWLQLDVTNMQIISQGSGDDITVRTNVPSQTWKPIYILNQVPDYQSLYSTGFVLNQTFGGNRATLSVKGTQSQTVFQLVKSPTRPQQVTANGTRVLPEVSSLNELSQLRGVNWFAEQNEGWFYDNLNQILYIKFKEQ